MIQILCHFPPLTNNYLSNSAAVIAYAPADHPPPTLLYRNSELEATVPVNEMYCVPSYLQFNVVKYIAKVRDFKFDSIMSIIVLRNGTALV